MIERQNLGWRGFRRRVGELLAVGKDAAQFDVRVKVAKQNLRRLRPLKRKRGMNGQKNPCERKAHGYHMARVSTARTHAEGAAYAVGGSVPPGPSERSIMIESVQRPNL